MTSFTISTTVRSPSHARRDRHAPERWTGISRKAGLALPESATASNYPDREQFDGSEPASERPCQGCHGAFVVTEDQRIVQPELITGVGGDSSSNAPPKTTATVPRLIKAKGCMNNSALSFSRLSLPACFLLMPGPGRFDDFRQILIKRFPA